jgi:hypothetical protein
MSDGDSGNLHEFRAYLSWRGRSTERRRVNRYFFNFRKGGEVSRDWVGMYLPDLDEARDEALRTYRDLIMVAEGTGEVASDCEIEIADASGEPVLTIPFERTRH